MPTAEMKVQQDHGTATLKSASLFTSPRQEKQQSRAKPCLHVCNRPDVLFGKGSGSGCWDNVEPASVRRTASRLSLPCWLSRGSQCTHLGWQSMKIAKTGRTSDNLRDALAVKVW